MIKRTRGKKSLPASLDPAGAAYEAERKYNEKVIASHAGKAWKDFHKKLVFKLYAEKDDVKLALGKLFDNRCAFCECSLDNKDLHIEHFRPKALVTKSDHPTQEGYWWLAATWENLLPACGHCNRSGGLDRVTGKRVGGTKGNRFPLLAGSIRAKAIGEEKNEKQALLDPTVDEPSTFLTFTTRRGKSVVEPVSSDRTSDEWIRANITIGVLKLNRSTLMRLRNDHLRAVREAASAYLRAARRLRRQLGKAVADPDEINDADDETQRQWGIVMSYLDGSISKRYGSQPFLHATVRCVEEELASGGLSLNQLLGGRALHIPGNRIG